MWKVLFCIIRILSVHTKCFIFNEKNLKSNTVLKVALFVAHTKLMLLDNSVLIKTRIIISCNQRYLLCCKICLDTWIWCSASLLNILTILYIFNLMFENSMASITLIGCSYFSAWHSASGILLWFHGFFLTWTIRTQLSRGYWLLLGIKKKLHKSEGLCCFLSKMKFPSFTENSSWVIVSPLASGVWHAHVARVTGSSSPPHLSYPASILSHLLGRKLQNNRIS